jgi:hypothetical protein
MDLLAESKITRHKKLFERILDGVSTFWEEQIDKNSQLADATSRRMFLAFKDRRKTFITHSDSRSEFFRHYSFVSLNLRDDSGRRYLRDELVTLYEDDGKLRRLIDKEVKRLTLRLIDGVKFANML